MYFYLGLKYWTVKGSQENPHARTKNEIENWLVVVQMHLSILLISQLKYINVEKEDGKMRNM